MEYFKFNRIFVIESLQTNEEQTGKELYEDLLRRKESAALKTAYYPVHGKSELITCFDTINNQCRQDIVPVLHLEIHGDSQGRGLVMQSGELVYWNELYDKFININTTVGNNLFVTLAVCHGAYMMELLQLGYRAPYYGILGSFDTLMTQDLQIRFYEFYDTLLSTCNLNDAYRSLLTANPQTPSSYSIILCEEVFIRTYTDYIRCKTSKAGMKQRTKDVINEKVVIAPNRPARRQFEHDFIKAENKRRESIYKQDATKFFMTDLFPENTGRFDIPKTTKQLLIRHDRIF